MLRWHSTFCKNYLKSVYFLFYQKVSNFGFLGSTQWYLVWVASPKCGGCWWILNCYSSRGTGLFWFFTWGGPGICTYVFLYKNLTFLVPWIRISLNLMKILQFLKISLILSLIYLKAVAQKCCFQQSWAWHEMALPMTVTLDGPMKAYREKAFFTESYFFCHYSGKWKFLTRTGGLGSQNNWWELLVGGDKSGFTLCCHTVI